MDVRNGNRPLDNRPGMWHQWPEGEDKTVTWNDGRVIDSVVADR